MSQSTRWTIAALLLLAIFVGVVARRDSWELTPTSHGVIPPGHGAVYELLMRLELADGRSYESESTLAEGATIWWIEPAGLCRGVREDSLEEGHSGVWRARPWIDRGGTAVVFLPERRLPCLLRAGLAGDFVPSRAFDDPAVDTEDIQAGTHVGPILRRPRSLAGIPLRYFHDVHGYDVLVADETHGPFVVSLSLGKGRLVLVASALPLRNEWLRTADAAPFIVDLVLAFGVPLIDEREHGLLPRPSPWLFLVRSAALPAIGGILLFGTLLVWHMRAEPPARLVPDRPAAPNLDAYIASVASLYRRTRDHREALRSYQEFALSQLRRSLRLPPGASRALIGDRLRASGLVEPDDLEPVMGRPACSGRSELLDATARIDALLASSLR